MIKSRYKMRLREEGREINISLRIVNHSRVRMRFQIFSLVLSLSYLILLPNVRKCTLETARPARITYHSLGTRIFLARARKSHRER